MGLKDHRKSRHLLGPGLAGLVLAVLATSLPLKADWLQLRDGSQIESDGGWQVDDQLVTFKLPKRHGLSSLRLDEVDLEESEDLTRRRLERAASEPVRRRAPAARRPPVLVLTDRDVRKVERRSSAPEVVAAASGASEQERQAESEEPVRRLNDLIPGVQVSDWRQGENSATGGVVIEGELRNVGQDLAAGLELTIALVGEDGAVIAASPARMSATTLAPRQRSLFRAEFAAPIEFDDVTFDAGAGWVSADG